MYSFLKKSTNLSAVFFPIPSIFTKSDVSGAGIDDPNNNLSNYDKKNIGSLNKKVLVSKEISGDMYYTFDEKIFD